MSDKMILANMSQRICLFSQIPRLCLIAFKLTSFCQNFLLIRQSLYFWLVVFIIRLFYSISFWCLRSNTLIHRFHDYFFTFISNLHYKFYNIYTHFFSWQLFNVLSKNTFLNATYNNIYVWLLTYSRYIAY